MQSAPERTPQILVKSSRKYIKMNVNPLLLALPVVFVAAIVVVPVALAALADGLGLHALPQDRRLLLLGCILRESIHNSISTQWITR